MRKEMGIVDGSGEGELGNGSRTRHRHDALHRLVGLRELVDLGIMLCNLLG